MKLILIVINLILAGACVVQTGRFLKKTKTPEIQYSVRKRTAAPPVRRTPEKKGLETTKMNDSEAFDLVVKKNIFNQERCPNAASGAGNARVQMTLVGIYTIGENSGAVILQKKQANNQWGGPPPMMNMDGGRRQGFMNRNNNNNGGRRGGNMNGPMGGGPMGGPPPPMMPFGSQNNNANQKNTTGNYKQYVRVGETMANGYKLVSVSRTGAVLTRGGDKLELELQDASVNAPKTQTNTNNRRNFGQQMINQMMQGFQNLQRMQGFQNFQMMRMMQNNNNNGPQRGGTGQQGRSRNNSRR